MTARLPPYIGEFPDQQEAAEECVRRLVERANERLTSAEALAVLRVCVEEMALMQAQIGGLQHEIEDLRKASESQSRAVRRVANTADCLANGIIPD